MTKISYFFSLSIIWIQSLILPFSKIFASDGSTPCTSVIWQTDDTVLLEWDAEPNAFYETIHSTDLRNWQNAVTGQIETPSGAERIQWIDTNRQLDGDEFAKKGQRYYRTIQRSEAPLIEETPFLFQPNGAPAVQAFRGSFQAPENRTNPNSREITVSYVRFPSTSATPGSPIILLTGGPGDVGEETARFNFAYLNRLREIADVIALNQRGTGPTNDVPVFQSNDVFPLDQPLTWEGVFAYVSAASEEASSFWKDLGIDISGYNTLESARDVEDLRRGLGAEKLTLWGGSFGSQLTMATAREMEGRIDRIIMQSIEGVSQTAKLPARQDAYFDRLQAAINTQPAAASSFPDLKGLMRQVHTQYEAEPLDLSVIDNGQTVNFRIGKVELQLTAGSMISNPGDVVNLPIFYRNAEARDLQEYAPIIYEVIRKNGVSIQGMREATVIMSGISDTRYDLVAEQSKVSVLGYFTKFIFLNMAEEFGLQYFDETYRAPVVTNVPTIVFSATLDGNSYFDAAEEALVGFTNLTRVTIINGGHFDFMQNPIVHQMAVDFMQGREVATEITVPLPVFPN